MGSSTKKIMISPLLIMSICICFSQTETNANSIKIEQYGSKYQWQSEWNNHIVNAIDRYATSLLDVDSIPIKEIEELFPDFIYSTNDEKKVFWIVTIAAICKFESNFNPNARFKEPPPLNVFSEGLLQLSYGDEKRYPPSRINLTSENILVPEINLETGILILKKQFRTRKTLFTTKHYYWSVLTNKKNEISTFIKKHLKQIQIK